MIVTTSNGINYVRLASMKGRVGLEKAGLKSRGGSMRKLMALEMGLKAGASYDAVINSIKAKMEEYIVAEKANQNEKLSSNIVQ